MIQSKTLIAMAIAAAVAAPAALAQTGGTPPKQPSVSSEGSDKTPSRQSDAARNPTDRTAGSGAGTFQSFDTNRDGYVSRDEAKNSGELNRQFNQLDKDRDGKLSSQELSGWQAGSPGTMGSRMGEGKVGASGSSGVGSSSEPSGGTRDAGSPPPSTKRGY